MHTFVVMDWKRQLGGDIGRARRQKGWTQEDLALRARFHLNTIGLYERGERAPDFEQLKRLAEALGRDYFNAGESIRIDFTSNGRPHLESTPQQLDFKFDDKQGVIVRIEWSIRGLSSRSLLRNALKHRPQIRIG